MVQMISIPSMGSDASGHAKRPIDWNSDYAGFILAGTSFNFQLWFRDGAAGGAGYNLTDGIEIPFDQIVVHQAGA